MTDEKVPKPLDNDDTDDEVFDNASTDDLDEGQDHDDTGDQPNGGV